MFSRKFVCMTRSRIDVIGTGNYRLNRDREPGLPYDQLPHNACTLSQVFEVLLQGMNR